MKCLIASLTAMCLFASARTARAVVCQSLPGPLYVTGSSAAKPLLAEIAKILVVQPDPVTIVYAATGSCTGVDAILNGTSFATFSKNGYAYWTADKEQTCDYESNGGTDTQADIGISDVFASTCTRLSIGLPNSVGDFWGPVQTMTFVTPKASLQRSISAEAAYFVFGFGSDSGAPPWTDAKFIFRRDESSGTQRMISKAVGVDASAWKGIPTGSSGDMVARIASSTSAEGSIGILAADVAQDNRATLSTLAYQHTGQLCGYYPDRDPSSNEKQNVRDGHYVIWGPLHLFTKINGSGFPVRAASDKIISYLSGTKAPPGGLDLIALEAARHVIPSCAMRVQRKEEMGALSSIAPVQSCGCYFEKLANGATACASCVKNTDCPASAPVCNYQYCETQ